MTSHPQDDGPQNRGPQIDDGTERSLESTEADFFEQHSKVAGTGDDWMERVRLDADDEVSEADAVEQSQEADFSEQHSEVAGTGDDWMERVRLDADDEVSEADAVEQSQEVGLDEDEYR